MSKRLVCGVALVALAACGGSSNPTGSDLCNKATTVINNFSSKNAVCLQGVSGVPTAPGSTCTQSLAQCSAADQAILNTFLDCLNGTPTCTLATASTWGAQVQACSTPTSGVSAACQTAIGAGG